MSKYFEVYEINSMLCATYICTHTYVHTYIEVCLCVYFAHFIVIILIVIYVSNFNLIVFAFYRYGHHYVYPILDWTNPMRAVTTFAGVFILYIIYGIALFLLSKFKRYLSRTVSAMDSPHAIGLI